MKELLILCTLIVVIFSGALLVTKIACDATTEKIGFKHSWGPMQGCLIEHQPGIWIPLKNYRVF